MLNITLAAIILFFLTLLIAKFITAKRAIVAPVKKNGDIIPPFLTEKSLLQVKWEDTDGVRTVLLIVFVAITIVALMGR